MPIQSRLAMRSPHANRALAETPISASLADREHAFDAPADQDFQLPPAKRRKFNIVRHRQTTLDAFAIPNVHLPARPARAAAATPIAALAETPRDIHRGVKHDDAAGEPVPTNAVPVRNAAAPKDSDTPQPAKEKRGREERRSLRSHDDGYRLKSELAIYYPDYEDIMLDVPKEPSFVTVDSAIYVIDDATKVQAGPSPAKTSSHRRTSSNITRRGSVNGVAAPSTPQRSNPIRFSDSPQASLDMIARTLPEHPEDPLTDEHFFKAHRRAERREKQLRNIEKERAMHEKVQLERILDGLLGHDWLKVLGITGITDGESKKYELKRDYFIKEVQTLVNKFKQWKEQEKRQRLEKEEAAAAAAREAESEEPESEDDDESVDPPSSDLNASATKQLQQEAARAAKATPKLTVSFGKGQSLATSASFTPLPRPVETPITSFYSKKHLRDAALGKARHGRNVTAFGHAVPEFSEREFELPSGYVTEDAIRSNARERRRRKRESMGQPSGP